MEPGTQPTGPDDFLAPGYLSETVRDIATFGGPARDVEQETLEAEAEPVDLLTGEIATGTEISADEETQERFAAVESLLGGLAESDDGEELSLI